MAVRFAAKNHSRAQVRKEFVGTSTDTKPVLTEAETGATLYETDTFLQYVWDGATWRQSPYHVSMQAADGPGVDGFSRSRVSEPFGVFDNKNVLSSNRNQWEEIINGLVLVYTTLVGGPFTPGEEIRGTTAPLPIATVVSDNGTDTLVLNSNHNDLVDGDTITGQTSGAQAVIVSTNTGSNIAFDYDTASVTLTAGTGATDKAIRQSHRYLAYVPGKSQLVFATFKLDERKANVVKRVGLFDDLNGVFFEQTENDVAFVIRSSTSGSAVDTRIAQADWNLDRLDGTTHSGINLLDARAQIFVADLQWLGVGRVRIGLDIDGRIIYCHEFLHANDVSEVYMRTPSLPIRFEITNTGATPSPTSMSEICSAVASEGGYALPGLEYSAGSGWNERTVSVRTPILAIRLKTEFPVGKANRRTVKFIDIGVNARSNDTYFEIAHVHEPVDITGATWTDVAGSSSVEVSTDITAITGRPEHVIDAVYAAAGGPVKSTATSLGTDIINLHGFISQSYNSDNSQVFVVYATPRTATADVVAHITWVEFE